METLEESILKANYCGMNFKKIGENNERRKTK